MSFALFISLLSVCSPAAGNRTSIPHPCRRNAVPKTASCLLPLRHGKRFDQSFPENNSYGQVYHNRNRAATVKSKSSISLFSHFSKSPWGSRAEYTTFIFLLTVSAAAPYLLIRSFKARSASSCIIQYISKISKTFHLSVLPISRHGALPLQKRIPCRTPLQPGDSSFVQMDSIFLLPGLATIAWWP